MSRKNGGIIGPANTPVGGLFKGVAGGVWRMNDVANFVSNSQWPTGPQSIDNSCRFDENSSDNLTKTDSLSNRKTFTYSVWAKKSLSKNDTDADMIVNNAADESNQFKIELQGNHAVDNNDLRIRQMVSGSQTVLLRTNRLFRDPLAWYHIVVAVDTTQSTEANRIKLYINGVQETSFSSSTYPSQDSDMQVNVSSSYTTHIGKRNNGDHYFDGYMAEFVFIDGLQLDSTSFGETDTATGIWKPKKIGAFSSAGDNSFYLDFKDSSNLGNDASGLNNDFTVNNLTSIDQSTDTCVENYATIDPLYYAASSYTLTNGNLAVDGNDGNAWRTLYGTFGLTSGKWYWEIKIDAKEASDPNNFAIGVVSTDQVDQTSSNGKFFGTAQGYAYHGKDGKKLNNDTVTANGVSYGDSYTVGDIVGVFLDLDNHKLYFSKNGTVQASGDPTSGSSGTNAAFSITSGYNYLPAIANYYNAEHYSFNFGNPPFSISSGNSDANGFGNFEYSVPSGYYALNTSNLNTYG